MIYIWFILLVLNLIEYNKGISHWASSSTKLAKCVFEPGTAADVGTAVRIFISFKYSVQ